MKKLFAVVIALAMLLSAAAVAEATDFTGMWYLNNMEMEGMTVSAAEFGMEMTFDLKEDGSADGNPLLVRNYSELKDSRLESWLLLTPHKQK